MALQKTFQTEFDVPVTHHKIIKIEILSDKQLVRFIVAGYVSTRAEAQGAQPLWHEYVDVPFSDFKYDPRAAFYPVLKRYLNSYLVGAVDEVDPQSAQTTTVFELKPIADVEVPQPPNLPITP